MTEDEYEGITADGIGYFVEHIDELLEELDSENSAFRTMANKDVEALRVNLRRARQCAANLASSMGDSSYIGR
jgi:hypothetical protein